MKDSQYSTHGTTQPDNTSRLTGQNPQTYLTDDFDNGEDVHIVGDNPYARHLAVGYDFDDDSEPEVAVIDIDDTVDISDDDVSIYTPHSHATQPHTADNTACGIEEDTQAFGPQTKI